MELDQSLRDVPCQVPVEYYELEEGRMELGVLSRSGSIFLISNYIL